MSGDGKHSVFRCVAVGIGVAAACLAAALSTTVSSMDAWFVGDDLGEIDRAWRGDERGVHVRPTVTLGLRLSYMLGGLNPLGYHVVGWLLHAVVIGLVGWCSGALADKAGVIGRTRTLLPWSAGAVFALLATHSESVSWISTRGDQVATGGALLAAGAWAKRVEAGRNRRSWTFVALAALVVALGSKEHAMVIPLLCVVVGLVPERPTAARVLGAVREALPLFAVLAAYVLIRALVLGSLVASYSDGGAFQWDPRIAVPRLVLKAARTVLPGTDATGWLVTGVAAALLVLLLAAHGGTTRAMRSPLGHLAVATAAMAALGLLPSLAMGVSPYDVKGERLLHLASAFAAIAVASACLALVAAIENRARRDVAIGCLLVALLWSGWAAVERDRRWADAGRLNEATLAAGDRWAQQRRVVVLNPADTVRGAYAHRNTLGDAAVVVHGWEGPGLVQGLAPMELDEWTAGATARALGERRWLLVPTPGRARFLPGPDGADRWSVAGVTARLLPDGTLEVEVGPGMPLDDVWLLDGGRFTDLEDGDP